MAYEAHEQRRRDAFAPDRRPERQQYVDRAAGRRDGRLSGARLSPARVYQSLREIGKQLAQRLPKVAGDRRVRAEEFARGMVTGGTLFEELGFYYVGPIDGHNLEHLLPVLTQRARQQERADHRARRAHQKGKGYAPAEASADKYHGVVHFRRRDRHAGEAEGERTCLHQSLRREPRQGSTEGREDRRDHRRACPPAPASTSSRRPSRIAPSTWGSPSSMASPSRLVSRPKASKPFCAIYSTFLQRAYDQVVHDVAIQNLPVRFAMDRAGLVGADGPTHAGSFDIASLGCLPNFVIMAAADEAELVHMVATAAAYDSGPIAFRYPRGEGVGVDMPAFGVPLEIGRGRILARGDTRRHPLAWHATRRGTQGGRGAGDPRPLRHRRGCALRQAARRAVDPAAGARARAADHRRGRFDRRLRQPGAAASLGSRRARPGLKVRCMVLPDIFIDHDKPSACMPGRA